MKLIPIKLGMLVALMAFLVGPSKIFALSSSNLVPNPLLETPSSGDPNIPDQWAKGYIDASDVVTYTYPVTSAPTSDISSGNAAKIVATTVVSGTDAKWYFTPVPVTPGQRYVFSDSYISTVGTDLVASFCTDIFQNGCSYDTSQSIPATPTDVWKQSSASFTVPIGKTYMTVFHRIQTAGSLTIDNSSLILVPPPSPFSFGFVTLTFDDGLLSQFTNALPVLVAGSAKGTFFIPTHFISGFSIINPSFENANGINPTNWSHSGSLTATYTYSSDAHNGTKSGQVASTTALSNAAWSFAPVTIIPDTIYSFQEYYKSTASSELVAKMTLNDGTTINADVVDSVGNTLDNKVTLPAASSYTSTQAYFYMPLNAKSVTILNQLTGIGTLTIDDVTLGREGYMTSNQVSTLQTKGNEIGGHTQTHPDLTTLTSTDMTNEINGGRQDLQSNGITPVLSFAYPFGAYNTAIQQALTNAGYSSGRTVLPSGFNDLSTPKLSLFSQTIDANTTLGQAENWVAEAKANKSWLILTFHDIQSDLTNLPYGTTPKNLTDIISYINTEGMPIKTISEGVALMGGTPTPTDVCPNVTGMQTTGPCADTLCVAPKTWSILTQTCVAPAPVDVCPNVTGVQTTGPCADTLCVAPKTWNMTTQTCVAPAPVDVCPNVTGVQTKSPCADTLCVSPKTWNITTQTCVAPVDVCPNVRGIQTKGPCADTLCVAPKTWRILTQTCIAPASADICPKVKGVQTTGPCADTLCVAPKTWSILTQTCIKWIFSSK